MNNEKFIIDLSKLGERNKIIAICNLHLFTPTVLDEENEAIVDHNGEVLYHGRSMFDEDIKTVIDYNPDYYSHFQLVVNRDGTLWYEANLYLFNMVKYDTAAYERQRVSKKTIQEHASALQKYKWFCDAKDDELVEIGVITEKERKSQPYWKVAKRPTSRPNISYKRYLIERIEKGELVGRTAKKYLKPVTKFYKFINEEYGTKYLILGSNVKMPGNDKAFLITTNNGSIMVVGNEADQVPSANNEKLGYIRDGGNTKPLTSNQQKQLFDVIMQNGQPEIIISHLFAIETAARMITVFTLRLCHFMNTLPTDYSPTSLATWRNENNIYEDNEIYQIRVGGSQLVDSKGLDREYTLQVPGRIMRIMQQFCMSERSIHRRESIQFPQPNPLTEYVFITKNFTPYYCSKSDFNKNKYKRLPDGGAIRTYKAKEIAPFIKFEFMFHFLRATSLMNMLKGLLREGLSESDALNEVRIFAGHKDVKTTKGYLEWKPKEEARYKAFETHAQKLYGWVGIEYNITLFQEEDSKGEELLSKNVTPSTEPIKEELLAENQRLKNELKRLTSDTK